MSKVTLKIGDILTSFNPTYTSDVEDFKITGFNGGIIFRPSSNTQLHICSHWYVNGIKYATEDIAIPPTDFSHLKAGQWIRSLFDIGDRRKDKWYQVAGVSDLGGLIWYIMSGCNEVYNHDPLTWDLSDVRDEDPNTPKEIKEDKEMFEPITEDNFQQVWINSNIGCNETVYLSEPSSCPVKEITFAPYDGFWIIKSTLGSIYTKSFIEFLNFIEKRFKLKPLPKFDLEEYIQSQISNAAIKLDAAENPKNFIVVAEINGHTHTFELEIADEDSADKVIAAIKILEGLK